MRRLMWVPLLLAAGCAWGPGEPFGSLSSTLAYGLTTPAGREAGNGFQKLNTDYEARFSTADLEVEEVAFIQPAAAAATFDPANPPPGYTICHNGHCDTESGEMVSYEEVAARLAGGGAAATPVVTIPVLADANLVAGGALCLAGCAGREEAIDLPLTEINRVQVVLSAGVIAGVIRDSRTPPRVTGEVPFRLTYSEEDGDSHVTVSAPLAVATGNDELPNIEVPITLALHGGVLDGIDFAALVRDVDGVIDLDLAEAPANQTARRKVLENLAAVPLEVDEPTRSR